MTNEKKEKKGFSLIAYTIIYFTTLVLLFTTSTFNTFDIYAVLRLGLIGYLLYASFKSKKLSLWIFTAMLLGIEVGLTFPLFGLEMERLGTIFLRLIKTLVAPLIMATLIVGIAGHSNIKQLGRIGLKSILYFEIVTTFALAIGLFAINVTKAGEGIHIEASVDNLSRSESLMESSETNQRDHIVEIFPENIAKSIANNEILQVVIFSLLFAVGLSLVEKERAKKTMLNFFEGLSEVMFKFTDLVMYVAPAAVFGALAATISKSGLDILFNLAKLVLTLYGAMIVFVLVILFPIALYFKVKIKDFWKAIQEPITLAFATASSEAALPKAMENLEKMGVSKHVVGFVLPTGYSFNLDGSTLYLSLATVFVAQMSGIDLTLSQQIGICLLLLVTSKGVAGVRGASFVILAGAATTIEGVTIDKVSVILAVDALMDMGRTSLNVLGNCLATVVIAKSENEFHPAELGE